ncbi:hypothetical protein [Ferrovum sp.]|uniref:hypothetical protein n=1 Tax=Ferrovum sp. TaxID=2609467 RepID=UPI0026180BB8|nr:hypothetical protein [Ferrovum sp.]
MAVCVKEKFEGGQDWGKKRAKFLKEPEKGSRVPELALARWLKPAFVREAERVPL